MFLLRVETNLKLNLVSHEGKSLIDISDSFEVMRPEIHFLQMEAVTKRFPMNISVLWHALKQLYNKKIEFEDWVIADLDNCLNGNPLVPPHPENDQ
jgi:hypothetical protein